MIMFKKYLVFWIFLWVVLCIFGGCFFFYDLEEAPLRYQKLLSKRMRLNTLNAGDESATSQLRRNVSKQILYTSNGKRQQFRLAGISSDLTFCKGEKGVVESIQGLSCRMQEDESLIVDSGEAQVRENEVSLMGEVKVQHPLGRISAHQFSLQGGFGGEKSSVLKISEDVHISFSGGGELICEIAEIDYAKREGVFLGNEKSLVTYKDIREGQKVEIQAKEMILQLIKNPLKEEQMIVKEVVAKGSVTGALYESEGKHPMDVTFQAEEVVFDNLSGNLTLKNEVALSYGKEVAFSTPNNIVIHQNHKEGRRSIGSVKAAPASKIWITNNTQSGTIHCPGPISCDCDNKVITMDGLLSPSHHQVYCDEPFGSFHADKVTLTYSLIEDKCEFKDVIFEGEVSLQNCYDRVTHVSEAPLHVALADKIEYNWPLQKMTLTASLGSRVLLFDAINHMQMSASQLIIKQHENASHPSIQGSGDVRFTFMENELSQMKAQFSFLEILKGKGKNEK